MTDDNSPIENGNAPENNIQDVLHCVSLTDAQKNTQQLIQAAHQEILIDSYQLDHQLYSHTEIADLIKAFCLNQSRARIKILLHDNDKIRAHGHHLIALLQRLTSAIEVRLPKNDSFQETLIIDQTAFMQFSTPGSYDARYSMNHRPEAQNLQKQFKERWEQATRDNRLLAMHI